MIKNKIYILFLFLIVIFIGLSIVSLQYHESAHREINNSFNCKDTYTKYSFKLKATTYAIDCPENTDLERIKLHMLNEITSYNNSVIYLSILFSAFLISFSVLLTKSK